MRVLDVLKHTKVVRIVYGDRFQCLAETSIVFFRHTLLPSVFMILTFYP